MTEPTLKPCPFHVEKYYPSFRGEGTQASLSCDECGTFWEQQICDLMTMEERRSEEGKFDMKTYLYAEKFVERARLELVEQWNTRAPSKDRELLVELSQLNEPAPQFKFLENFGEGVWHKNARALSIIARRIRKHLEENS